MLSTSEDLGKLVLRLCVGILLLFHGIAKLGTGIGPIEAMMAARGMPVFFAWGVYIGEIIAPTLLILGIYARLGALLAMANMLVAIALAHTAHLLILGNSGGWRLELPGLFLFGSLAIVLLGAGRFSIGGKMGRWN